MHKTVAKNLLPSFDWQVGHLLIPPHILPSILLILASISCTPVYTPDEAIAAQLPAQLDFNIHIKPLLSDRCFKCHGPDKNAREADLRLDIPEEALKKTLQSGGYAFVAGQPLQSEAFTRLISHNPDLQMPPPEANLFLTDYEIALIGKWIEQGARYKPHWAFIPPVKVNLPTIKDPTWPENELDYFILAQLEARNWSPSKSANKAQLLRRVSFDLTGLPPTLAQLDDFTADNSPDAYERQVDRLLASPAFGERMAVDWLDIARYADSHGYQDDGYRFVWPWRDWVVKAFNENMPYNQFIEWQLAGDLLPEATQEQRLATTFLRNHRINSEAGIVGEEYRVEYVADRTNTLGAAVLGLTLECARCHDHKYDPISQQDYYRLFAYFNNVNELGEIANDGNPGPLMMLTDEEVERQVAFLEEQIKVQEKAVAQVKDDHVGSLPLTKAQLQKDLKKGLDIHLNFEVLHEKSIPNLGNKGRSAPLSGKPDLVEGKFGQAIRLGEFDQVFTETKSELDRMDPFSVSLWVNPIQEDTYTPLWGDPSNKNIDFKGYGLILDSQRVSVRFIHALPHNHIHIRARDTLPLHQWSHIVMRYDGSSEAKGIEVFVNGKAVSMEVQYDHLYKSFKRPRNKLGGGSRWGTFDGGAFDEVRIYHRQLSLTEIAYLYQPQSKITDISAAAITEHQLLHRHPAYQSKTTELKHLRSEKFRIKDTIREIMVMEEMDTPRPTFVLNRGVYDAPEKRVYPAPPERFGPLPAAYISDRRGLAQWLTHPQHSLTARVAVNRLWKQFFGQGLVETPMDLGNQGSLPSHPYLLDWLATDFVENNWDIKTLVKKIVLSASYRQDSQTSDILREKDPKNIFLGRGPRARLTAEMIRDNALAVSGLLVSRMGGPPVKPYQPPGLWKELAPIGNLLSQYKQDEGDKNYRRSLYTIWKRTAPPPALQAFDAPTRELCQVARQSTTTPLQSLVLWNDPQWLEAARMIGERMMQEAAPQPHAQISLAFRLLTSRMPKDFELERLLAFYNQQLEKYSSGPKAAEDLLAHGEYPKNGQLDIAQLASCTMVAHTILNMDEAIVRY